MFTGIAEGKGVITALEKNDDIVSVEVKHSLNNNDISVNDSICCSGICLTVIKQNSFSFKVEMVPETIKRSTADHWDVGTIINLSVDHVNIVHERGNLEFNGVDAVILNWSTIGDPNRNLKCQIGS